MPIYLLSRFRMPKSVKCRLEKKIKETSFRREGGGGGGRGGEDLRSLEAL